LEIRDSKSVYLEMNASVSATPDTIAPKGKVIASLWMLLAASVCVLLLRKLVHQSFFFDGGIYASLARNLAEGTGSAWRLHFSNTLFAVFSEHPPLMMWLESLGFMVFGDTIAVEKSFSLLTFAVSGMLLFKIWTRLHDGDPLMQRAAPLALFMTLVAGRVNWGFANGMLENLLTVFTLCAILLVVTAYDARLNASAIRRMALVFGAGVAIVLALLTKGPVGLFPWAAPMLYWMALRRPAFSAVVLDSIIIAGVIVLFFLLLWSFDESREASQRYLSAQLLSSLVGERGYNGGGLAAFRKILLGNGYSLLILALVFAAGSLWRRASIDPALRRDRLQRSVFLLLVGCSASLPIAISPRVANFYFNPSLPYFSAGLCALCAPVLMEGLGKLREKGQSRLWMASIGALALGVVVVGVNVGRLGVDRQTIMTARKIVDVVCSGAMPCDETISACGKVLEDWALHTYMQRYYKISIADTSTEIAKYLVSDDSCGPYPVYTDTGTDISPYRLLRH
jgi:4-amino-4-deoxy-L-arabinose transferase-like glycosyltransferase